MDAICNVFLDEKAKTINHLKNEIASNVIEIGRHLSEARQLCEHGKWDEWCSKNINFTARQATTYIRVFERFGNRKLTSDLGIEKLNLLAQLPDDIDTEKFSDEKNVKDVPVSKLKDLIKSVTVPDFERAEIEKKSYEAARRDSETEYQNLKEDKIRVELSKKELESKILEMSDLIKEKDKKISSFLSLQKDTEDVKKLKKDIQYLQYTRDSFQHELKEIEKLVQIKHEARRILKEISPIMFMKLFNEKKVISEVAVNTYRDIVLELKLWIKKSEEIIGEQK